MQRTFLFRSLTIIAALTTATPLLSGACKSASITNTNDQLQVVVPFAVPVGVPVAPFAPYFYSCHKFQPQTTAYGNPVSIAASTPPAIYPKTTSASNASPAPTPSPIATHCTSCHGGPSPKASLSLEHPESLTESDRLAAIRAVITGLMPKGSALSAEDQRAVISALASQSNPATAPPDHQPHQ